MKITLHWLAIALASVLPPALAQGQNLFESDSSSGNIYEFTPNGTRSTFASGLSYPEGLALNSAGNLFVAAYPSNIYEFTPNGGSSTFASGLGGAAFLAFQPVPEPSTCVMVGLWVVALLGVWRRCQWSVSLASVVRHGRRRRQWAEFPRQRLA